MAGSSQILFTVALLFATAALVYCGTIPEMGLKVLGSSSLKTYFIEDKLNMNWTEAWKHCNKSGMSLATLESEEEKDALVNMLGQLFEKKESFSFWLDGQGLPFSRNAYYNNQTNMIEMEVVHKLYWNSPPSEWATACGSILKYSGDDVILLGADDCKSGGGDGVWWADHDGAICQKDNSDD